MMRSLHSNKLSLSFCSALGLLASVGCLLPADAQSVIIERRVLTYPSYPNTGPTWVFEQPLPVSVSTPIGSSFSIGVSSGIRHPHNILNHSIGVPQRINQPLHYPLPHGILGQQFPHSINQPLHYPLSHGISGERSIYHPGAVRLRRRTGVNRSVLVNPTIINSPIRNSTLINPRIITTPAPSIPSAYVCIGGLGCW